MDIKLFNFYSSSENEIIFYSQCQLCLSSISGNNTMCYACVQLTYLNNVIGKRFILAVLLKASILLWFNINLFV